MITSTLRALARYVKRLFSGRDERGKDPQTLNDRALARRLRDAFEPPPAEVGDVQGLHFYAQGGAVAVYGTVQDARKRERLLASLLQLEGVERVESHLKTRGPAPGGPSSGSGSSSAGGGGGEAQRVAG